MDQSQQQQRTVTAPSSSSRSYQFHPARAKIIDLFNLYLGVCIIINLSSSNFETFSAEKKSHLFEQRGNRQKPDEPLRDPPP